MDGEDQPVDTQGDDSLTLKPGDTLAHFEVMRLIGRGGMGAVYLAHDLSLGRKVALKLLELSKKTSHEQRERLLAEARATARFSHPNIVTVYEVGEHEGSPFLALEYVEGQTLRERLASERPSLPQTVRVAAAVARAVEEAHRAGILHRDLKPENVILGRDGRVRVLDFGMATAIASEAGAPEEDIAGTPHYLAPEIWHGQPASRASDVWAFGIMLFELLTGRLPFANESVGLLIMSVMTEEAPRVGDVDATIPAELQELVASCLQRDPDARPPASHIAATCEQLLQGNQRRAEGDNPFRGLLAFDEAHAANFFGRDDEIGAFLEHLRDHPVASIVGVSGAGKSSFVRAGVIPRLRELGQWRVLVVRPGGDPFTNLARQMIAVDGHSSSWRSVVGPDPHQSGLVLNPSVTPLSPPPDPPEGVDEVAALRTALAATPGLLATLLRAQAREHKCRVLLFVDQLEELVTLVSTEQRHAFLYAMCAAADDSQDPVRVIFTLRDDFLGRIADLPQIRAALAGATILRRPGPALLRETIARPLQAASYRVDDPSLIDEMVSAVDPEYGLPLLQFAAQQLWARRDKEARLIRRADYEKIGGVTGALTSHADTILSSLTGSELGLAREMLLRLVTPERTRRVVAQSALLAGLSPTAGDVLTRFLESRLLVARRGARETEIEIAHESLARTWGQLAHWIDETKEQLVFLAEAEQAALLWQRRGKHADETWAGDELRDAERNLQLCVSPPPLVVEFIARGRLRQRRRTGRRRALLVSGFVLLAAISLGAVLASVEISGKEKQAQRERATALLQAAIPSLRARDNVVAKALLRTSLENQDSQLARMSWAQLHADPMLSMVKTYLPIISLAASTDGERVLAGSPAASVYSMDMRTLQTGVLHGANGAIFSLSFHPVAGVAAADENGYVTTWNGAGEMTKSFRLGDERIGAVARSPDGELLAVSTKRTLEVFDSTGAHVATPIASADAMRVKGIAVHPKRALIAVTNGVDRVFEVSFGGEVGRRLQSPPLPTPGDAAVMLDYTPDGSALMGRLRDGRLAQWSDDGALVVSNAALPVEQQGFSAGNGGLVATINIQGDLSLWRFPNLEQVGSLLGHDGRVLSFAFTANGRHLVSSGEDRTTRRWDVQQRTKPAELEPHTKDIYALRFISDGARIISAGADSKILIWNRETGKLETILHGHTGVVFDLQTSQDSSTLVSLGDDGLRFWDLVNKRQTGSYVRDDAAAIGALAANHDFSLLAIAARSGDIELFDARTRQVTRHISTKRGIGHLALSSDSRTLAAANGSDPEVTLWDVATGRLLGRLVSPRLIEDMAFVSERKAVVVATRERQVYLLPLDGSPAQAIIEHDNARVNSVAVGPEGLIVSGGFDNTVRTERAVLQGRASPAWKVAVSADGRFASAGGPDGQLDLWELASKRPLWRVSLAASDGLQIRGGRVAGQLSWPGLAAQTLLSSRIAADGRSLCGQHLDGRVELWSLGAATPDAVDQSHGLARSYEATTGGCAILRENRAIWLTANGAKVLREDVSAVGVADGVPLLATTAEIIWFDADGLPRAQMSQRSGVTALSRSGDLLVVGFEHGDVETIAWSGTRSASRRIENTETGRVERIVPGPHGLIAVAYNTGHLVVAHAQEGTRLWSRLFHGAPNYIRFTRDDMQVTSELGDETSYDISILATPYCSFMHQVWEESAVAWLDGRPTLTPIPRDHPCSTR